MEQRQLLLMRHASASPDGERDHARRLTDAGRNEAHRIGTWLASEGMGPDRILSSSALRCRETCEALSAGLGAGLGTELDAEAAVEFDAGLYNASSEALLASLREIRETRTLLLLAHNPGISVLALELALGTEAEFARLREGFFPATVACFELEADWPGLSSHSARLIRYMKASES